MPSKAAATAAGGGAGFGGTQPRVAAAPVMLSARHPFKRMGGRIYLHAGVTVIMAHCASLGRNEDLDHPGSTAANFDLFLRMMGEERYQGLLFGDLSAITQVNRMPRPLLTLLRRPDLQERLVNGSDYPLPGVNAVIWTRQMVTLGLITAKERKGLDEIFRVNPLLFDFVLKRIIRDPRCGRGLAPGVFLENPRLLGTIKTKDISWKKPL